MASSESKTLKIYLNIETLQKKMKKHVSLTLFDIFLENCYCQNRSSDINTALRCDGLWHKTDEGHLRFLKLWKIFSACPLPSVPSFMSNWLSVLLYLMLGWKVKS